MYAQIIISTFLNFLTYTDSKYIGEDRDFSQPKLQRNNILNKGLWMKDNVERSHYGDFIFRADSRDVDNLLSNNFDAFAETYMEAVPILSSYVQRNKRSTIYKQNQQLRKSLNKCKDKSNCLEKDEDTHIIKSKFISKLKPTSVFNDYPYEVAVLLANNNKREITANKSKPNKNYTNRRNTTEHVVASKGDLQIQNNLSSFNEIDTPASNKTFVIIPRRKMINSNIESEAMKKFKHHDAVNKTEHIDGNKIERNVFEKEDGIWHNAHVQNTGFNLLPKSNGTVGEKQINEKVLVKVLSLLTKTFRKVIKEHTEIQQIDRKLHSLNEHFMENVDVLNKKFEDFDERYGDLLKKSDNIKHLNEIIVKKIQDFERRDSEVTNDLVEFKNQQKNFLDQQRQFYTIQKLMLDQNEKINWKQGLIARTQSEISHRQNNFARVLKKAKQLYVNTKYPKGSNLNSGLVKPNNTVKVERLERTNITTSTPSVPTQSVKINLFSVPQMVPIINQDRLILNEKDNQPVDDLVYKYYFNNTFIADVMKNNILAAIFNDSKGTGNTKNKRNNAINLDTTLLLPVSKPNVPIASKNLHRERRWIRRSDKDKKKFYGNDKLFSKTKKQHAKQMKVDEDVKNNDDPYLTMATNFCVEVGQNVNAQMLNWCVEKSLRRLKSIDMAASVMPLSTPSVEILSKNAQPPGINGLHSVKDTDKSAPVEISTITTEQSLSTPYRPTSPEGGSAATERTFNPDKGQSVYFPDNDELESNLKQYDLTKDPEGTVYFDGSIHTSDMALSESDALSDVMPGLDSNSRVEVDPLTLDLQERRGAYVRRLNENILKNINY